MNNDNTKVVKYFYIPLSDKCTSLQYINLKYCDLVSDMDRRSV